jgi:hypothetical protein
MAGAGAGVTGGGACATAWVAKIMAAASTPSTAISREATLIAAKSFCCARGASGSPHPIAAFAGTNTENSGRIQVYKYSKQ